MLLFPTGSARSPIIIDKEGEEEIQIHDNFAHGIYERPLRPILSVWARFLVVVELFPFMIKYSRLFHTHAHDQKQ